MSVDLLCHVSWREKKVSQMVKMHLEVKLTCRGGVGVRHTLDVAHLLVEQCITRVGSKSRVSDIHVAGAGANTDGMNDTCHVEFFDWNELFFKYIYRLF